MTASAAVPAVIAQVAANDAYLMDQIADEIELAKLLGWTNLEVPQRIDVMSVIWGRSKAFTPSWSGAQNRTFLPKWRRTEAAFDLISACLLTISPGPTGVSVNTWSGGVTCAVSYADHPSKDHAIRYAMCKAAIAYLTQIQNEKKENL